MPPPSKKHAAVLGFPLDAYIRISAGGEHGQFGTEWWFRKGHVLLRASDEQRHHVFQVGAFTVVFSDPRRLFVRFRWATFGVLFIALHAPHRATEQHLVDARWKETLELTFRFRRADCAIVAGDWNCALDQVESQHVGCHGAEAEDDAGAYAHRLIVAAGCWLLSTFAQCHRGDTSTYTQKRGGSRCRLDFVGVPCAWGSEGVRSQTLPEVHVANAVANHNAVAAYVELTLEYPGARGSVKDRRFPLELITALEHATEVQALRDTAHAHAAIVTSHVQQRLSEMKGKGKARPHHAYLTETT